MVQFTVSTFLERSTSWIQTMNWQMSFLLSEEHPIDRHDNVS